MEQARLLIAIVLSFLVFFLWNVFFVDPEAPEQRQVGESAKTDGAATVVTEPDKSTPATEVTGVQAQPPKTEVLDEDRPSRTVWVETPLYRVQIAEKGGLFTSFVLKKFKESTAKNAPNLDMIAQERNPGSLRLGFGDDGVRGWQDAVYVAGTDVDLVKVENQSEQLVFTWVSDQGVTVEKAFTFFPDSYRIGLSVKIDNGSEIVVKDRFYLAITNYLIENTTTYGFEGPSALINGGLEQVNPKDIPDQDLYNGTIEWIAVQDRYFMSSIIPKFPEEAGMRVSMDENRLIETRYVQTVGAIEPGTRKSFEYELFFGPKSLKLLREYGHNLDRAINFGWFDFIAKPCVWVMNFLYGIIPNYGVAIIILTLGIKIILWPLGNKSYKSMAEMKKIQPLVGDLREKYKDDKKKMNEEMMKLYRVYKVNPLGGCLPMVLQIPVFFALYRMLYETIELRHAPFFAWITDLSAPDRLFEFGFKIPFMQPPYGIPVLTIIMGASMLLQQKMSPPPGDPTQAKIMMLMPIVFTVIFINFSSGLVLYWLVSNLISIAQQYYVTKKHA